MQLDSRLASLNLRFDAIEGALCELTNRLKNVSATQATRPKLEICSHDTPEVATLRKWCYDKDLQTTVFQWVDSCYYSKPLQWRRDTLKCPSINHLCKSILLENTHCPNPDCAVKTNSRFYLVVFQYVEKFDSEKLLRAVKNLNPGVGKKQFNFRLADPAKAQELTGFGYNAVVPFGGRVDIPVILSEKIACLQPGYFWMGGGHEDCKLRMDVNEFLAVFDPLVADISNPLPEEELNQIIG